MHAWEEIDGIRVLRVGTYLSANKGFVRRTANYVSFMVSAVLQCWRVKGVDLVVSTSPQFFCGMGGYFVSRLKSRPWVLEIRDLWPESIIAVGAITNRRVIRMLEGIESFLYRKADRIVSLTNAFKRHIMARGIPAEKIAIVTNGADLERYVPGERMNDVRKELGLDEGVFLASYIGTHGMAHGLGTVLRAAKRLEGEPGIRFLLVGDGAERERLLKEKEDMGLTNVHHARPATQGAHATFPGGHRRLHGAAHQVGIVQDGSALKDIRSHGHGPPHRPGRRGRKPGTNRGRRLRHVHRTGKTTKNLRKPS